MATLMGWGVQLHRQVLVEMLMTHVTQWI